MIVFQEILPGHAEGKGQLAAQSGEKPAWVPTLHQANNIAELEGASESIALFTEKDPESQVTAPPPKQLTNTPGTRKPPPQQKLLQLSHSWHRGANVDIWAPFPYLLGKSERGLISPPSSGRLLL